MEFHAAFTPRPFDQKINYRQPLFLIGSCFTEEIGNKLLQMKYKVLQNPAGILFNPVSISRTLVDCAHNKKVLEADLFQFNELWHSWEFHSRFSNPDKEDALQRMNASRTEAHEFLKKAEWVVLTLGSAFIYETKIDEGGEGKPVANCHKIPTDKFNRRLLSVQEVSSALKGAMEAVHSVNKTAKFIFTVSPVRHLREGFIENNRSKAALIQAVHELVDGRQVFYFPSYELVIDDLRDYRFYAEDMVHPNYAATNYVWEKFIQCCMDDEAISIMNEWQPIQAARRHKPFHPGSAAHKKFLNMNLEKLLSLKERYPFLDLDEEKQYFSI